MTTENGLTITTTRALSTPLEFTDDQRRMIRDSFANGASDAEFAVLMEIAKARRLNPLLRQVHFVSRWDTSKGREVWATQVSIDGLRAIAERTGLYAGQDKPEFTERPDGSIVSCEVRVYRKDWPRPAVGVAYWSEYVQTRKDKASGKLFPTSFWQRMPHTMLAKCAEALALRKAFPEDMSGLYTADEMGQAENDPVIMDAASAVDSREGFASLDASRQIAAPSRATRQQLPDHIRDHAEAIAGHNPSGGEWRQAVAAAETDVRTAEYRVSDAVNDLRESASMAESLTALAQRWIAAKRDVSAWDDRAAQEHAWSAFKARARELGATIKALQAEIVRLDAPPPPDGTDGPHAPRSASNDTARAEGSAAPSSGTDGHATALAHPEAWRLSAHGITAHVAEIGNIHRLSASARKHLPLIAEVLRTHAVHEYAGRLQALSHDGTSTMTWEACIARAETWLREGPRAETTTKAKRAA